MAAVVTGYEFSFTDNTDPANPVSNRFGVYGVSQDTAKGIRFGLRKVPTLSNVVALQILEDRTNVPAGDPT